MLTRTLKRKKRATSGHGKTKICIISFARAFGPDGIVYFLRLYEQSYWHMKSFF